MRELRGLGLDRIPTGAGKLLCKSADGLGMAIPVFTSAAPAMGGAPGPVWLEGEIRPRGTPGRGYSHGAMSVEFQETVMLLERGPAVFDALLRGLPDVMVQANEGDGSWTVYEVVGHLLHCERTNWMVRARELMEHGEEHTFAPFVRAVEPVGTLGELLDQFAEARAENLRALDGMELGPEAFARRAQHPAFGAVTLGQLLATWATHDLTHLHQVSRILASRRREDVGPWSAYLGVLTCAGHSE
jgi:uncharacterized damage-inducible protein DinB